MAGPRSRVLRVVAGLAALAFAAVLRVPGARGDEPAVDEQPVFAGECAVHASVFLSR